MRIGTIFASDVTWTRAVCGFLLGVALCAPFAIGEALVSLPTAGRFRAGRYMPARVQRDAGRGAIMLRARGMLPTSLAADGPPDVIVPWLALSDSISDAQWEGGDGGGHSLATPLHALSDDERLVGFAGTSPGEGRLLFPGKTIVPVELDLSRPLLEPAEAWECLDAVVLSAAACARLDESHLATLLAGGTLIAVRSDTRPDARWPWTQVGKDWVLRFSPAGPPSIIEPAAYSPTYDWERGWPATFRRRVFLAAVLFCLLGGAVLLWRSRWTAIAFLVLSCLVVAAFGTWYGRQSPMLQLSAGVRIDDGPVTQFDLWTWQSPMRSADGSFPAAGLTRPALASARQAEQTQIRLECSHDGRPERFLFHLDPGQSLAFRSRDLRLDAPAPPALSPARGPFADLASTLYLRSGQNIGGEYVARAYGSSQSVPVIVLRWGSK